MNTTTKDIYQAIENKLVNVMKVSVEYVTDEQLYKATALALFDYIQAKRKSFYDKCKKNKTKQIYYLSMEFLVGKSLKNSLYNLDIVEPFQKAIEKFGSSLEKLTKYEPDPGLGNGGLGRLAACYLDALATDGYLGTGYSILYEYGIFKQKLEDGWQRELPDYWLPGGKVWLQAVPEHTVPVMFGGKLEEHWDNGIHMQKYEDYETINAVPYNMYCTGYDTESVSLLRLWEAKSPGLNMELFNNGDYLGAVAKTAKDEAISKILYPNDNHKEGKELRLKQQYFLVAASVGDIIRRHVENYGTVENFGQKNAIHINDTHPTLAIPELMRILLDDCGYAWDESWKIVKETFSYTNHTVMPEALEKWDLGLVQNLLPRVFGIICEIDRRFWEEERKKGTPEDAIARMAIIGNNQIRMANLCVIACHHINGVSALHSELVKSDVFPDYAKENNEKFTNVTNGIASRRWLLQANTNLTEFLDKTIGKSYRKNLANLENLMKFADDEKVLRQLGEVKHQNKVDFANWLKETKNIEIDPNSIFYTQVKRLHEYKRQQLNALQILNLYLTIKANPKAEFKPRTYIFGAKAASGYYLAKEIIKYICDLAKVIDEDPDVQGRLKIVFLEEYNVTTSEHLMPASDVSMQISLAGTEASGTSNMKLMLSGAITLGTLDGANIEISEAAGIENELIFGLKTEEVEKIKANSYNPRAYSTRPTIEPMMTYLKTNPLNIESFAQMANYYENADPYMALADYEDYARADNQAADLYYNQSLKWQKMSLINIAKSGYFCADRAIHEYAAKIWGI